MVKPYFSSLADCDIGSMEFYSVLFIELLGLIENVTMQDKKVVKLSPDDNMYMEGFALRVFAKADKQDRAGRADLYVLQLIFSSSYHLENTLSCE